MLGAIYISQSGMTAYSTGLDVLSNNVANLNTTGFKVSNPVFTSEVEQNDTGAMTGSPGASTDGAGVSVATQEVSFQAGNTEDTSNPMDAAIDGNGFFVLQQGGQLLYTREGQFEFDSSGALVDTATQAPVMVSTDSASETTFNVNDFRVYPPKATTTVSLTGTLAQSGTATFNMPAISLIDSEGASEQVTFNFTRDSTTDTKWTVQATDANGKSLGSGTLEFGTDGTPQSGNDSLTLTLSPSGGTASTVTVNFGTPGSFTGITSITGNTVSNVTVQKQDGVALGALTGTSFNAQGQVVLTYSNGSTQTPATLLLAQFNAPQQLKELNGALFTTTGDNTPQLASAGTVGLGNVQGSQLEESNVDLTQQFSSLIIIERGYQACSQTSSVADQMIQQLLQIEQHS
jgi:flagellar hook protein FlgE